ncbi:MAG: hemerythrin domain-containing protein [Nocardioidaceae bacterium]|nr:hemerythrin domain-containing protein [Nocardioidaceae bacterium]
MTVRKSVSDLVTDQHVHIAKLLDEVVETAGEARRNAFGELCRMLEVHEAAEREVLHPVAEAARSGVVEARLSEQNQLRRQLDELRDQDVNDAAFVDAFAELRRTVQEHLAAVEREELPLVRDAGDEAEQLRLATAMRAVEDRLVRDA